MSALVSIIIPVYNLENYIGNCLEKLICQTYKNFEVICIDDGSTDFSARRINEFSEKDRRIRYFYQENSGVSAARNKGLDLAQGDYVMFVDGDDYLHYQAVEIFVDCMKKSSSDVLCAPEQVTKSLDETMDKKDSYSFERAYDEDLFSYKYGSVIGKSVWSKIYKRDIAQRIKFNTNFSNGEDADYIVRLLCTGIIVSVVDVKLYYYYTREDSCVTSNFTKSKFTVTESFEQLCDLLKDSEHKFLRGYCLQYLYQTIFYNRTLSIGTPAEEYVLKKSKKIGRKWIKDFIQCSDIDLKIRLLFIVFFYSRHLYELARMIQDPTMKDFYKSRKQNRKG